MNYRTLGTALGWFSIALGAVELLGARRIAKGLDAEGHETVVRGFGAREVAAGVALLADPSSAPRMWNRVAGDAMDLAALGALVPGNRKPLALWGAIGFVVGAAVADILVARGLEAEDDEAEPAAHPS